MADNDAEPAPVEPGQEPTIPAAAPQQPATEPPEGGEPNKPSDLVSRAVLDEAIGTRQAAKERKEERKNPRGSSSWRSYQGSGGGGDRRWATRSRTGPTTSETPPDFGWP